jgi:hypothetical protein
MGRVLRSFKDVVDWAQALVAVVGWLGVGSFVTSFSLALGSAALAAVKGVALPIVIMAGFCAMVAAAYLALIPMLFRLGKATIPVIDTLSHEPDWEAWSYIDLFTIRDAARLWCETDPTASQASPRARQWEKAMLDAIRRGHMKLQPIPGESDRDYQRRANQATSSDRVTRSDLRQFAVFTGKSPRFLGEWP